MDYYFLPSTDSVNYTYFNVSDSTDSVNYTHFNVSVDTNDTDHVSQSGGPCSSGMGLFRFIAEVWIVMPIACLGIIGNILAFIVLCNHKQKLTTTIILQCLAFVDTLILLAVIPLRSLFYSYVCVGFPADYKEPWKLIFRVVYPMLFVFRMVDTWLITLLTLDRWIAVCRPLHAPRLCTKRSTYIRIIILVVSAILLALPRFFESTQYGFFDVGQKVLENYRFYIIIYQVVFFFLGMYLVPMVLLVVLNIQLILALRRANASFAGRRHSQSSTTAQRRGITVIVVTVVTTCIICNLTAMVSHFMHSVEKIAKMADNLDVVVSIEEARRPLSVINNIFIVFNSSINFFLYCFSSKNFRQITYHTLCCIAQCRRFSPPNRFPTSQTSNTYDTYVPLRQTNGTSSENGIKLKKFIKPSQ